MFMRVFHISFLLIIFCLVLPISLAQEYYADVQIRVWPAGEVEISGTTNYPALKSGMTQNFTSKSADKWILNMTFPDNFSEYVYDVSFPPGTEINYLNVPKNVRMETEGEVLHVIGSGINQKFFLTIQYSFGDQPPIPPSPLPLVAAGFIIAIIAVFAYRRFRKISVGKNNSGVKYNPHALTDRQRMIVDAISKNKAPITQAKLQTETKIPKASLSRNLDSLIKKGIVKKERKGMTMVVYFNEEK